MKDTLTKGLTKTSRFGIDEHRTISFIGDDCGVYATPYLLYDIEVVSRNLINEHLDEGEDSVGTHADISHMAATPSGMWADIKVTITEVKGRKVDLEFECKDAIDAIAKGTHSRFIVDKNKAAEQIKSKMRRAAGDTKNDCTSHCS